MQFYFCVICNRIHEDNPVLPCSIFKAGALREVAFDLDYDTFISVKQRSQSMMVNSECPVQVVKV
jgi:hypothetical protein